MLRGLTKKYLNPNYTDFRRWSNINNFLNEWVPRNIVIASMIAPHSKILEFGAGTMTLPKYLPEDSTYIPSDIIERIPGMLVCDLNAVEIPSLPIVDVAVFSGVLEYINDIPRIISHLSNICTYILTSYTPITKKTPLYILRRRASGWVNDYTEEEFLTIFRNSGFVFMKSMTHNQEIVCKFQNHHTTKTIKSQDEII